MIAGTPDGPSPRKVVLVNNNHESFTPTDSGAIATWMWEVALAAQVEGVLVGIVTRESASSSYPWDQVHFIRRKAVFPNHLGRLAAAVTRRLTGWTSIDTWAYARAVCRHLHGSAPGTAIVCHNDPELAVLLSRRLQRVMVIHWFHNPAIATDRWRRRYRTAALSHSLHTVAVSNAIARMVELTYVLPPLSVTTVINGVDTTRFYPSQIVEEAAAPAIGFLGRTGIEKGLDVLLRASLMLSSDSQFSLQIVGDNSWGAQLPDEYQRNLAQLIDQLRSRGVPVTHFGHLSRDRVPEVLRATQIYVMPSRWDEPCSLSLLEGMASGLAVVATATGGTPEVLREAGLLVARDDSEALAQAIGGLLRNPDQRVRLGRAARSRAEELPWQEVWRSLNTVIQHDSRLEKRNPGTAARI